ncbi:uncharacterized protein [Arachis hypogaea]|uniref:uncharacterized protein isoform X2 n=1 Tax=Arachis hypogaea TaxID=3818 RepID=UPI000DEC41F0|nr:uncharacterized protein LOC112790862 isoform X2 [Arachis hypogaea]
MKDPDKIIWEHARSPKSGTPLGGAAASQHRTLPKLLVLLILFVSVTYVVYTLKLLTTSRDCHEPPFSTHTHILSGIGLTAIPTINATASTLRLLNRTSAVTRRESRETATDQTQLRHVVFGIAASSKLWEKRKNYIKLWYKANEMRGVVWLDNKVSSGGMGEGLPPVRISGDTSKFSYTNKQGHRSAIRISRIVSETLALGMENVRWFVMGDDDTVFVTENLIRVLRKYDHNQFYYIGSLSESHLQNIYFSYGMAYGGGGFAISYPLAKALQTMQDRCIQRYPGLYGSDDRMQACMAELGVPLTKEAGFHQPPQFPPTPIVFLSQKKNPSQASSQLLTLANRWQLPLCQRLC